MLEYPNSRFMSVCEIATRFPTIIVAVAMIANTMAVFAATGSNAKLTTRTSNAIAATFGPTDMKAAAGVGAPWYASGVHA